MVKKILNTYQDIEVIAFNRDFSPYSKKRDSKIEKLCKELNVTCIVNDDDLLLVPLEKVLSGDGDPLVVFGSYYKEFEDSIHMSYCFS